MQPQIQVLVNMRSGDKVLYDVENYEEYRQVCSQLYGEHPWVEVGKTSFIRTDEIMSVYYLPEGYGKSGQSSVKKD